MGISTVCALLMIIAIAMIITVTSQLFIDDYLKPRSTFGCLLVSVVLTTVFSLAVDVDIPE